MRRQDLLANLALQFGCYAPFHAAPKAKHYFVPNTQGRLLTLTLLDFLQAAVAALRPPPNAQAQSRFIFLSLR